jgi:hypothetical protein
MQRDVLGVPASDVYTVSSARGTSNTSGAVSDGEAGTSPEAESPSYLSPRGPLDAGAGELERATANTTAGRGHYSANGYGSGLRYSNSQLGFASPGMSQSPSIPSGFTTLQRHDNSLPAQFNAAPCEYDNDDDFELACMRAMDELETQISAANPTGNAVAETRSLPSETFLRDIPLPTADSCPEVVRNSPMAKTKTAAEVAAAPAAAVASASTAAEADTTADAI